MSIQNRYEAGPIIGLTLLFGHLATVITFSTYHQDALIFHGFSGEAGFPMDQAGKGRMALNEHARVQRNF